MIQCLYGGTCTSDTQIILTIIRLAVTLHKAEVNRRSCGGQPALGLLSIYIYIYINKTDYERLWTTLSDGNDPV